MNRRQFIKRAGGFSGGLALGATVPLASVASINTATKNIMAKRILILGGTGFIGPPMLKYAVDRGHKVSIFTRGETKSSVPGVEHLVGDRKDDLSALKGRNWDVVLDNNARDYRWVKRTTALLKDRVGQYLFVSSISAYAQEKTGYEFMDSPWTGAQIDTNSPLAMPPADFEQGQKLPYGQTKALSEKIVAEVFPGRSTIVRPGFIVGPGDKSDRFTYWPARIHQGGEVLAPGDGTDPVQIIDVRDLTEWMVRLIESGTTGVFNGVGIGSPLSMARMLYGISAVTSSNANLTWVPISFLRENDVSSYFDMPIWIPGDPLSTVDNSPAMKMGLTFRPLAVTALDTLNWHLGRPGEQQAELRIGIKPERENQVLSAWKKNQA